MFSNYFWLFRFKYEKKSGYQQTAYKWSSSNKANQRSLTLFWNINKPPRHKQHSALKYRKT